MISKGVVAKVKKWLSPSTWTGYFNNSNDHAHEIHQRPQLGQLHLSSQPNVALFSATSTSGSMQPMVTASTGRRIYATPLSNLASRSRTDSSPPPTSSEESHSSDSVGMAGEDSMSNSDESWVAEDVGEEERFDPVVTSRPAFISLSSSRNEDEDCSPISSGGDSPLYTYSLGEGTADVVQHSSLLLTPGAEAPVERVTNPLFASQLPQLTLHGQASASLPELALLGQGHIHQAALKFPGITCASQSSMNLPGQSQTSQSGLTVSGQARSSVVTSTYTVTLTKPLMASTVARAVRLPGSSLSYSLEQASSSPMSERREEVVSGW